MPSGKKRKYEKQILEVLKQIKLESHTLWGGQCMMHFNGKPIGKEVCCDADFVLSRFWPELREAIAKVIANELAPYYEVFAQNKSIEIKLGVGNIPKKRGKKNEKKG